MTIALSRLRLSLAASFARTVIHISLVTMFRASRCLDRAAHSFGLGHSCTEPCLPKPRFEVTSMTLDDFRQSLTAAEPPPGLTLALAGLWWDGNGDWTRAH